MRYFKQNIPRLASLWYILLLSFLVHTPAYAVTSSSTGATAKVDSLKKVIQKAEHLPAGQAGDTSVCRAYLAWGEEVYLNNPDTAIILWQNSHDLAEKNLVSGLPDGGAGALEKKYLLFLAEALNNIGYIHDDQGDIPKALEFYHKSLKIQEELGGSPDPSTARAGKSGIALSLNNIGLIYKEQGDIPKALEFYHKSLKIHEEIGEKSGMAMSLNNIGGIYGSQGDISKALEFYHKSLKIYEEIGKKSGIASSLNNIGVIYKSQGDIPNALECYHKSLKILEEIGERSRIAGSLNNIGVIYNNQGDILKALEFFIKSWKMYEEMGDKRGIAHSLNNIGYIYENHGDPSCVDSKEECLRAGILKALEFYHKSLKIREEIGEKSGIATSLNNIGYIYRNQGDPSCVGSKEECLRAGIPKALEFYHKSLKILEEIGERNGIAGSLKNIGDIELHLGNLTNALEFGNRGLEIGREIGSPHLISINSGLLSKITRKQGNYQSALEMYELHIQMRDSIKNEETQKASIRQQTKYEFEKAMLVKEQEEKEAIRLE
ncbi:MAG: tetratricopeptide repeat protein, partial [Flavobacteriales bacterium]|nr:tetratricopeptide repeat protein [Flavobacteriales bacterium]